MVKNSDLEVLASYFKCLIVLENKTSLLYKDLAERVELPLVRSLLLEVSFDSQKHSTLIKGLAQSIERTDWKPDNLPKNIAEALRSIDAFQIELSVIERLPTEDLLMLPDQLTALENMMSEQYDILTRLEFLEILSKQLGDVYKVNLQTLNDIFTELIYDEQHHREILSTIKQLLDGKKVVKTELTPVVRFQNPDAWSRPAPITA